MDKNKSTKVLKAVTTLFLPLSVISVSLLAVICYALVWVGSSGGKKRYFRYSAGMYLAEAALSLIKLYVLSHFGVMGRSFAFAVFGRTAFIVFWAVTAVIMAVQGILSARAAKSCTDNGRFLE